MLVAYETPEMLVADVHLPSLRRRLQWLGLRDTEFAAAKLTRRSGAAIWPLASGEVAEWLKAADCKSARASVRWFESSPVHHPATARGVPTAHRARDLSVLVNHLAARRQRVDRVLTTRRQTARRRAR